MPVTTFSVFVSHLPQETSDEELRHLGAAYGSVKDVYVNNSSTEQLWTYGFIRFSQLDSAIKAAKELNGWRFKNKSLVVELAKATSQAILNSESFDKQSLRTALPSVDPSVQLPTTHHEPNSLLDKVVNLNRLQDICSMINFEALQTKDTLYVNKILTVIEDAKGSSKIPAMDMKLSSRAQQTLTSLGKDKLTNLSPSSREFQEKFKEVSDKVQALIYDVSAPNKTACKEKKSPCQSGQTSGGKCPRDKRRSTSNPTISGSQSKSKDSHKGRGNSSETQTAFGKPLQGDNDETQDGKCTKLTKQMCGLGLNYKMVNSAPHLTDGKNLTSKAASKSKSCDLLRGDVSSLALSKLNQLSNSSSTTVDFQLCEEGQIKAENSTDIGDVSCVENLEELLSDHTSAKMMSEFDKPWGEGKRKNIPRKSRSEWASELFFQILSDHSDSSCMSADDSGQSSSGQQFQKVCSESHSSQASLIMPPLLKRYSQPQYTGRESSE